MTKVKNKAVKYNKNAEALLTFGLRSPIITDAVRRDGKITICRLEAFQRQNGEKRKSMKQTWNSFLQTVFQSIKMLSASAPAKRRRDTAVLTAGILLVTAITFAAGAFRRRETALWWPLLRRREETGGQEEGTYDGNTDEEKRDPESIMAAEEAADTENGTGTRKEEAENGAETSEGGEAGEGETLDQEAETAVEGSGAQEEQRPGRLRARKPRNANSPIRQLPERALSLRKVQPLRRLPVRLHRKHRKQRHRSPCQTGITRRCLRSSRQRLETATGPEGSWWPM